MTEYSPTSSNRVVALDRFPDLAGQSLLSQVEAYWLTLGRDGLPPARAALDPRGIEAALHHAFVIERIARAEARIRVGGTHLTDLMGMEVRGMPLSALIAPDHRAGFGAALERVFDDPALARLALVSPGSIGAPLLQGRLLLLPLRDEAGAVTRALGCLVSTGVIGRGPRRFGVERQMLAPLEALHRPTPVPMPQRVNAPGLAEAARGFSGHSDAQRTGASHLRLVKSE